MKTPITPQEPDPAHENGEKFNLSFTYATHNPALIILRDKGYHLSVFPNPDGGQSIFIATASDRRFAAYGGAELLGLVIIWEHFGENWNIKEPDIMDEAVSANEPDGQQSH